MRTSIQTDRLLLRAWREDDLAPFAAMNADSRVMEHFPSIMTREESDAFVARIRASFEKNGFGLWAVELRGEGAAPTFVGFVGLSVPAFEAPFTPCVEIGWRLAYDAWNKGIATEGARATLDVAFGELQLP